MWHPVPGQVPLRENRTDVSEAPRHLSLIFTSKHFVHIIGKYAFQLSVSGAQQKGWEPHPAATKWSQEARGVCSESEGFYACKDTWACHSVAIWWILWFGLVGFFLLFFSLLKTWEITLFLLHSQTLFWKNPGIAKASSQNLENTKTEMQCGQGHIIQQGF